MNDDAIARDELMNEMGFFKERLSCSVLYYEVEQTANEEAEAIYQTLLQCNIQFGPGNNEEADLTGGRHQAKQMAYVMSPERAGDALAAKCDCMQALGIEVFVRGVADWR
jgi:hypothetical protein